MRIRILAVVFGAVIGLAVLAGPTAAQPPNQGDSDKVLVVDNPNVSCADPEPLGKVEGGLGRTIFVQASQPIDFVTIKSGQGAVVVSAVFDEFEGEITLSKDVSNYVVWVCEEEPPRS